MKNLIVTTAMMLFILMVMGWQMELQGTLQQKQRLQYAAEEAAASVAAGAAADEEAARKTAEESIRLQMDTAGGPASSEDPVLTEVSFDRKETGALAVVVTVRQGKLAASGWYPVLQGYMKTAKTQ